MATQNVKKRWSVKPPLGTRLNRSHELAQGLVLSCPFNEMGGSPILDYAYDLVSTNNNNPAWTTGGRYGAGQTFDGSTKYQKFGNLTQYQITGPITMEAAVNVTSWPGANLDSSIIGKGFASNITAYVLEVKNTAGTLQAAIGSFNSPTTFNTVWNVSGWNTGEWHHLAGTYDGTNWNLYFDGILVSTTAGASGAINNSSGLDIGNIEGAGGWVFNGSIALARVWNRTLVAREIEQLFLDPWGMFVPQSPLMRQFFPLASAAAQDTLDWRSPRPGLSYSPVANRQQPSINGGVLAPGAPDLVSLSWASSKPQAVRSPIRSQLQTITPIAGVTPPADTSFIPFLRTFQRSALPYTAYQEISSTSFLSSDSGQSTVSSKRRFIPRESRIFKA